MIRDEIDIDNIVSADFAVALQSDGTRHFVPTDGGIKDALKEMLNHTVASFNSIDADWEAHDISEDYGNKRRIYASRDTDYLESFSDIFNAGEFADLTNADEHAQDIDYYFSIFRDNHNAKIIGIKKAAQLKGTLKARGRVMQIYNDTLQLVRGDILKLDTEFDALIADQNVFMLNVKPIEYMAKFDDRVVAAAKEKIQQIHDAITFLDFSGLIDRIEKRPAAARMASAIAQRDDLAQIRQDRVREMADEHGINFEVVGGRLRCQRKDEMKLLQILDYRRYGVDLTGAGPLPFVATARKPGR